MILNSINIQTNNISSINFAKMKEAYRDSKAKKLPKATNPLMNNLKIATALRKVYTEIDEMENNNDEEVRDLSTLAFFDKFNKLKEESRKDTPNEYEKYTKELEYNLDKNTKIFNKIGISKDDNGFYQITERIYHSSSEEDKKKEKNQISNIKDIIEKAFLDSENYIKSFKTYDKKSSLSNLETGLMYDTRIWKMVAPYMKELPFFI